MTAPQKVVLLIEDSPDDVDLTLRAFRKASFTVRVDVARDGVEALEALGCGESRGREPGALPDVILLDLKLPRVDGLQVLERLRASPRTRLVPVVVLTTSREEKDVLRAYGLGANSYVRKPVDYAALAIAVQRIGAYWLELNEPAPRSGEPR